MQATVDVERVESTCIPVILVLVFAHCRVKNVLGFDAADFVGTRFNDYFHPADHARMTPCHLLCELKQ